MLNLLTGIGLKLFGEHAAGFFSVVFHILGFAVALCLHALTLQLSKSRITAAVASGMPVVLSVARHVLDQLGGGDH